MPFAAAACNGNTAHAATHSINYKEVREITERKEKKNTRTQVKGMPDRVCSTLFNWLEFSLLTTPT